MTRETDIDRLIENSHTLYIINHSIFFLITYIQLHITPSHNKSQVTSHNTKHNMKFRQIGHTTSQYGQSFFPKTISALNGLAFAEAPSLAIFRTNFLNN